MKNCPVCDKSLDKSVIKCSCSYEYPAKVETEKAEEKPKGKKK
jgi:hypothetical protein